MASIEPDGRLARTQRTRAAIVDALLALLAEGEVSPSAERIAGRAGISKRSIFVHFSTLEDLYRELADRGTAMVLERVWVIDPELPLDERIDQLCAQRAEVNEAVGPLRRAATRVATSTAASASQRFARESSKAQVARVFAPELAHLDPVGRAGRIAAADAVISGESWDLWRTTHALAVDDARAVMRDALAAMIRPPG